MSSSAKPRIARDDLTRLRAFRTLPNLTKIPLFVALMVALTWLAWFTPSTTLRWAAYIALGYLWMGMVTFMHDATHDVLFRNRTAGWLFGIVTMIPIFASFVAFKEDHLEHHRYNVHHGQTRCAGFSAVLCLRGGRSGVEFCAFQFHLSGETL